MKTTHNKICNELFSMLLKGELRTCICNDSNKRACGCASDDADNCPDLKRHDYTIAEKGELI